MATLTAFYDLSVGPVSFDVVPFLVQAKMAAARKGCKRLHVVILPDENGVGGMFRDKTALYDEHEMHWRLWNIVIPACQLAGATVTLAAARSQAVKIGLHGGHLVWPEEWDRQTLLDARHHARPIVQASRAGERVPRLTASQHALRAVREWFGSYGRPVVTMTLRHTYDGKRNANTGFWDAARKALAESYEVIVLRDTADALIRGEGYGELNLDLRMAMYESAVMNLHCHGGPAQLCWFSDAPFIMFDARTPESDWGKHWDWLGLKRGDQLPWARPDQRLEYGPIDPKTIRDLVTPQRKAA